MNIEKFEEFISQYPIFEYRLLDTEEIGIEERVRTICRQECERYDSTWACPPAVGTLEECEKKIKSFPPAYCPIPEILSVHGKSSPAAGIQQSYPVPFSPEAVIQIHLHIKPDQIF